MYGTLCLGDVLLLSSEAVNVYFRFMISGKKLPKFCAFDSCKSLSCHRLIYSEINVNVDSYPNIIYGRIDSAAEPLVG